MQERCRNCKISRSFEDGPLGPESSLTIKQSLEYIESMKKREDELKKKSKNLQEQLLEEERQPYIDDQGDIIVPVSWRDGDDLSDEEYADSVDTSASLKEQLLVEDYKPYYDEEGMLILPSSWKDEDDSEEGEYWRKFNPNKEVF